MSPTSSAGKIHTLPGDVVSRIAAGEVIERPAAVVKELVENSLDAGSRTVTVEVKNGGLGFIQVTDDGEGMSREDLPLAFERHATSKLRSDRDLAFITTMGFRGEALPSIASVSVVQATSATRTDPNGWSLSIRSGKIEKVTEAAAAPGTRIEISDLFHNQPARKKFLKSTATEFSHIVRVVQQAGLAWPSVHFRLFHNGQEVLNYPSVNSDRDRVLQVYRSVFLDRSVAVEEASSAVRLTGFTVEALHAKTSRTPQELFVNRRPVRHPAVFHAVADGYGAFLPKGCHPVFVLFLDVDPDRVDVNVHPAKREVRFADVETIHQVVRRAVRHALGRNEAGTAAAVGGTIPANVTVQSATRPVDFQAGPDGVAGGGSVDGSRSAHVLHASTPAQPQLSLAGESFGAYAAPGSPDIIPLGQLDRTFLVAQVGDELQVIDQHTAHERVLFERLLRAWQSRQIRTQPLLIPDPVELSPSQAALLQRHLSDLEQLGLSIEPFGASTLLVRETPVGLDKLDVVALLHDLLEDVAHWDARTALETRAQPVLASLACHGAVRAGRSMALPEIRQLIGDWLQEGSIMTCPHGRRTAFRLGLQELAKIFSRV